MMKIIAKCKKHPHYKAKLPPRVECAACKELFNKRTVLTMRGQVLCSHYPLEDGSVLIECVQE